MIRSKSKQKIDAYSPDAETPARPFPRDNVASRQDISTPSSILIEFEATEYSYRFDIRFVFEMLRIFDSMFDSNDIPDSSDP